MNNAGSRWLVEASDGSEVGPISTREVAEAILSGKLAYAVRVAAPGAKKWLRAVDVPVIAAIVESEPTIITTDPPVDPQDEARTPRQSAIVPTRESPPEAAQLEQLREREIMSGTPSSQPPTRPRPYRRYDKTVESAGGTPADGKKRDRA